MRLAAPPGLLPLMAARPRPGGLPLPGVGPMVAALLMRNAREFWRRFLAPPRRWRGGTGRTGAPGGASTTSCSSPGEGCRAGPTTAWGLQGPGSGHSELTQSAPMGGVSGSSGPRLRRLLGVLLVADRERGEGVGLPSDPLLPDRSRPGAVNPLPAAPMSQLPSACSTLATSTAGQLERPPLGAPWAAGSTPSATGAGAAGATWCSPPLVLPPLPAPDALQLLLILLKRPARAAVLGEAGGPPSPLLLTRPAPPVLLLLPRSVAGRCAPAAGSMGRAAAPLLLVLLVGLLAARNVKRLGS